MEHSSWSLASNARNKMVTKILDTLQKHLPDRGPEGMDDLKNIALRFEEKIYSAAADQQDYLRKISTKMISLETKSQVSQGNTLPIISAGSSQKPQDPGPMISSQLRNPSQTLANDFPLTGQSQLQQQLQQNLPNSMNAGGVHSAAPLASALSPVSSLPQSTGGQCFGTQNSILNSTGQGLAQNVLLANAQRQMQTRQQQHQQQVIQQQQSQVQQQFLQHNHAILKQRLQQQSQHGPSMLQQQQQHFQQPQQQFQHQQQHIQNQQLVQQNQLPMSQQSILQQLQSPSQSSQQSLMQHSQSSVLQSAQQAVQQQTQPSTLQQTSPSVLQKHQQSVVRHQQPQQAVTQHPSILKQQPPSLTNVSDMQQQQQQQQLQQLLQTNNAQHQQTQQASSSLLPSQSEQLQQQPQQQQLLSKLQPQPQQLQQQQPVLLQPNLTQQELQPRLHTSSVLLQQQQQNSIEQQKQLLQFQSRMMSDAATTNMDSSAQTGQTTVVEMQERIYQRMQLLKEMYLPELQELYQKLHIRSQQTMPRDQLVKLQQYKDSVNGFIRIIQHPRSSILTTKEEKVDAFEMKIKTILSQARLRRPALQQEGQQQIPPQAGIQVQSIQQSQLQTPQMQQQKHVNHLQQMNSQVPMTSMQSNTVPPIQHSSTQMLLQSGLQTSQQNIRAAMQSVGSLNSTQGSGLATFQQSSVSSLQHNNNSYALQQNNSAIQQNSINSLQQSGISTLQNNINPVQSNVNALNHHQAIKQQEMLQLQAHRKIMLAQQQQQQQQPLHQSQQFRQPHLQQLQQKQQQAAHLQAQFQAQQMPQLPQINDMNDDVNLKLKQTATVKQTLMQQNHSSAQRTVYQQQQQQLQFKTGTSLSVSSSPLLSTASPQVSQQSSPQIGQQNLVTSSVQVQFPKVGTPLQQMTSEDAEKQSSALSSISNVGCAQGVQQTATAIAIGAPGISASPLLDGFSPTHSHNVVNQEQTISAGLLIEDKSSTEEAPFERLIKVINKMSYKALASAVNDIGSVVSLMDRMAGSAPGNGSRAAVGEDLAAMTKCRLQARNLMSQDGNAATKKMKRHMNSIPLNTVSSGGTLTNSFQQYNNEESLEIKSTATSRIKRPRLEMSHVLQDELQEIYQQLIDTAVEISEDDDDATALAAEGRDGVVLKCYYNAKALSANMKSGYRLSQMTPISPLCLLIPADYPNSSPVLLDKAPTGSCKEYVDLSSKAREKFHAAVRTLPQPMSILALARTWDVSARSTVVEYAQQSGGGSFSSCFGTWESCTNA